VGDLVSDSLTGLLEAFLNSEYLLRVLGVEDLDSRPGISSTAVGG